MFCEAIVKHLLGTDLKIVWFKFVNVKCNKNAANFGLVTEKKRYDERSYATLREYEKIIHNPR
jgi:hypothetical protein